MPENEHLWCPLSLDEVAHLFEPADFPWWIAGGHAIEHAVGHPVRPHADIDILVLRRSQLQLRRLLGQWDCWAADPPGVLRPWPQGEVLPFHVNDVWCRLERFGPWRFQVMLEDGGEGYWLSRRNRSLSRPLDAVGVRDQRGTPFLAPEIQLFYKAKAPRPKDDKDFEAVLPFLSEGQKAWLRDAIGITYGQENTWLGRLI